MLRLFLILCIVFVFFQSNKFVARQIYGTGKGTISFHSDAPLELITASSNELRGKFDKERKVFAFSIRINSFSGFNSSLQKEHFNENYLESSQFPNASFSGKIIEDVDFSTDGTYSVRAKGNLFIHGVEQERIIKSDLTVSRGKISIKSDFTVLLADHNISVPKVVHEKLASEIKVAVKADLTSP